MKRLSGMGVLIVCCWCGYNATQAQDAAIQKSKLDQYFERYCDYTGGSRPRTRDYKFRQRLKETKDPELKRLFVLQHLHWELEFAMRDYQRGEIRVGKVE